MVRHLSVIPIDYLNSFPNVYVDFFHSGHFSRERRKLTVITAGSCPRMSVYILLQCIMEFKEKTGMFLKQTEILHFRMNDCDTSVSVTVKKN